MIQIEIKLVDNKINVEALGITLGLDLNKMKEQSSSIPIMIDNLMGVMKGFIHEDHFVHDTDDLNDLKYVISARIVPIIDILLEFDCDINMVLTIDDNGNYNVSSSGASSFNLFKVAAMVTTLLDPELKEPKEKDEREDDNTPF